MPETADFKQSNQPELAAQKDLANNSNNVGDGHAGLFTLVALAMLLAAFVWLKGYSLVSPPQRFSILFHDVAGLNNDGAVNVDGLRVGSVEHLTLRGKRNVVVGVRINADKIKIPVGSRFTILTNGVVGAKYIEITLPDIDPKAPPAELGSDTLPMGDDPVRPELVANKVAMSLDKIDFEKAENRLGRDLDKFAAAADHMSVLSEKIDPLIAHTSDVEDQFGALADEMRGTTKRVNRVLDNPQFSSDLKETAERARQTAKSIESAVHELNSTLSDKPLRNELLQSMTQLKESTEQIRMTADTVQRMSDDKGLRNDLKDILSNARDTMTKVDDIVSKPTFGTDLKSTLIKTQDAITRMDAVADQVNQILDKKHPLVHMIFGRPGHLTVKTVRTVKKQITPSGSSSETTTVKKEIAPASPNAQPNP